jgi:hypothetical protein
MTSHCMRRPPSDRGIGFRRRKAKEFQRPSSFNGSCSANYDSIGQNGCFKPSGDASGHAKYKNHSKSLFVFTIIIRLLIFQPELGRSTFVR